MTILDLFYLIEPIHYFYMHIQFDCVGGIIGIANKVILYIQIKRESILVTDGDYVAEQFKGANAIFNAILLPCSLGTDLGVLGGPPSIFLGDPKLHKEGRNVALGMHRTLVLNNYPPPPCPPAPLSEIWNPPLYYPN